jgi:hypothetical protein
MDDPDEDKELFLKSLNAKDDFRRTAEKYMKIQCALLYEAADKEISNKRTQNINNRATGLDAAFSSNFSHAARVIGEPRYYERFANKHSMYGFITGAVLFLIVPNLRAIARFLDDFIDGVF